MKLGIGVERNKGLHAEAQALGVDLVDARLQDHGAGIDDRQERLAGEDLVAFPNLPGFVIEHDVREDGHSVDWRSDGHLFDVALGALQLTARLVEVELGASQRRLLRFLERGHLLDLLLVRQSVLFDGQP